MAGFGNLGGSDSRSRRSSQEVSGQFSSQTGGSIIATTGGRNNVLPGATKVTVGKGGTYAPTYTTTVTGGSDEQRDAALMAAINAQSNREFASPANYTAPADGGGFDPKWFLILGAVALGIFFFFKRR